VSVVPATGAVWRTSSALCLSRVPGRSAHPQVLAAAHPPV